MTERIKKELIEYGRLAGEKGFTPGTTGNLSARLSDDKILITVSGSANGYLSEDDFAVTDFDGGSKCNGLSPKPSSERMLHAAFYAARADVNYIIHVHSPCLSAFASCRVSLDEAVMAENVFYFGKIPLAPYALPSSDELVEKTAQYFKTHDVVLMANHGVIIGGSTMHEAYLKLETAEAYAQTVLYTRLLGGAVLLTPQEIEQIERLKNGVGA